MGRSEAVRAARALLGALIVALTPAAPLTVSAWAETHREVGAESGSPFPGKWRNDRVPYAAEPMDCLSPEHWSTDVTLRWAAQTAKTEVGLNFAGYNIGHDPAPMLIVLPSIDESLKFVRTKLQPTIDSTPALSERVLDVTSRDEKGSTTSFKRFRGGFAQVTHAGSSKGLQMISVKRTWGDEISEFPLEAGERGDPCAQIVERTNAWSLIGAKRLWSATPRLKGSCRISKFYEESDQRKYYVPCPQCGAYQSLEFVRLKWASDKAPHGAYFACAAEGCVIEHWQKAEMLARGVWLKTFPASDDRDLAPADAVAAEQLEHFRGRSSQGRQPGFHLWQAYSPFRNWDDIVAAWIKARGTGTDEKAFSQQVLAEPYEEAGEAPDHLGLLARREERVRGVIPAGVLALTGFCDVQKDRLVWGVYGWGEKLSSWYIDGGVISGDPEDDAPWASLAEIIQRRVEDEHGRTWPIEAFGVDSGYKSHAVYNFARRRPHVYATDGVSGWTKPFVGTPKKVDVNWRGKTIRGGALKWPLGVDPIKSALYSALQKTLKGPDKVSGEWLPGAARYPADVDEAFFLELTAEYLDVQQTRAGFARQIWRKRPGQPNEQLDIWVGCRGLAGSVLGLDRYRPSQWAERIAAHAAPAGEADLLSADQPAAEKAEPLGPSKAAPAPQRRRVVQSGFMKG